MYRIIKAFVLFSVIFILTPVVVLADDVSFSAVAKKNVQVGERFKVSFSLNAKGKQFTGPSFGGFKVLMGPSVSTQQGYSSVNGRVQRTMSQSYEYVLEAVEEGVFEIDAASVKVGRKVYESNPITVKVSKAAKKPTSSGGQNYNDYAFMTATANKAKAFLGEQIIVEYKLYLRVQVVDNEVVKLPKYKGFWTKSLLDEGNPPRTIEVVDGVQYNVYTIAKDAIFPQRVGTLEASPLEFKIVGRFKDKERRRSHDPFDDFFGGSMFGSYKNVPIDLRTKALKFEISELPLAGKSGNYSGLVGQFNIGSFIQPQELNVNDALTYKLSISGSGNIGLYQVPELNLPPDFEVYDPKVVDNISVDFDSGVKGSKTFEWVIIPKSAGTYKIPSYELNFFDNRKNKYVSKKTKEYTITVNKGKSTNLDQVMIGSTIQEDVKHLGSDIRYIHTGEANLKTKGSNLFNSTTFYVLVVGVVILGLVIVLLAKKLQVRNQNHVQVKNRKANRVAVQRMKTAKSLLDAGNETQFYEEISKAIWGYLSDKFNIPNSDLSFDAVRSFLSVRGIDEDLVNDFDKVMQDCEYARFAPGDKSEIMNSLYDESLRAIVNLEKALK